MNRVEDAAAYCAARIDPEDAIGCAAFEEPDTAGVEDVDDVRRVLQQRAIVFASAHNLALSAQTLRDLSDDRRDQPEKIDVASGESSRLD